MFIATVCTTMDDVILGVFPTRKAAGDACRRVHKKWVKKELPYADVLDCLPEKVAAEVGRLLSNPDARTGQSRRQTEALDYMGRSGADPSTLAAEAVLNVIAGTSGSNSPSALASAG